MLKLGQVQTLRMIKRTQHGVYLSKEGVSESNDKVLLPNKYVPNNSKIGDGISVFIFRDSSDRLIASSVIPPLTLGKTAVLKVKEVTKIGAFVDWGLEKDLFLPYAEMTERVKEGEEILCALYIDKSDRLCATMKVYPYLSTSHSYKRDDEVKGRVYEISDNFGAFVAVDDKYSALIPGRELFKELSVNSLIEGRVTEVTEEGKLTLSIRKKAYLQMEEDALKVFELIKSYDGVLPFNDKASAETIKRETGMSKNEFKRAVGRLYKERRIVITDKAIRINE
ncbi:MAG: RNA-binding protein [Lachnospiraceae bacterium]|nr:RNA-binding protein [Lachnospiraceae bacterium]